MTMWFDEASDIPPESVVEALLSRPATAMALVALEPMEAAFVRGLGKGMAAPHANRRMRRAMERKA